MKRLNSNRLLFSGFYDGIIIVGPHQGKKVQDVKKIIQKEMIQASEAVIYMEPEKTIISRSALIHRIISGKVDFT